MHEKPAALKVESLFRKTLLKYSLINPGEPVLTALSGGADSVLLCMLLKGISSEFNISLTACHVNHNLRGEESIRDSDFSRKFASVNGIPFIEKNVNAGEYAGNCKISIETAARVLRYNALEEAALECGAAKIATAHNLDDQAETVLFRLFKGAGPEGITGIPVKRDNIIRPLLFISRGDIEKYLSEKGIGYVTDSSNEDISYDRNFIRKMIVPAAVSRFPALREKISDFCNIASCEEDFWKSEIGNPLRYMIRQRNGLMLNNKEFKEIKHLAVRRRVLRAVIKHISGGDFNPGFSMIDDVLQYYDKGKIKGNKVIFNNNKIRIISVYGNILIEKERKIFPNPVKYVKLSDQQFVDYNGYSIGISEEPEPKESYKTCYENNKYTCWFDSSDTGSVKIRAKSEGDRFLMTEKTGKKIKKYFTDKKIPLPDREETIVFETGSREINRIAAFFIPDRGFMVSYNYFAKAGSKRVHRIDIDLAV